MSKTLKLLTHYFKSKYSRNDYNQLKEIIFSPDNDLEESMHAHWIEFEREQLTDKKEMGDLRVKINREITKNRNNIILRKFTKTFTRIAAIIVLPLMLALGILYFQFDSYLLQKDVYVQVVSPTGSRTTLNLPDGSTVWLNGESSIRYPAVFNEDRRVEVKGEAFFKVHSDKKNPFLVGADDVYVSATGTEFNVLAYDDDAEVRVILKEGHVAVLDSHEKYLKDLEAGYQLSFDKQTEAINYSKVDVENYSNWINGKLTFQNTPMPEVVRRLERWYGVKIEIADKDLMKLHFKATFTHENIEEALKLLQMTATFHYKFEKRLPARDGSLGNTKILITKNMPM